MQIYSYGEFVYILSGKSFSANFLFPQEKPEDYVYFHCKTSVFEVTSITILYFIKKGYKEL